MNDAHKTMEQPQSYADTATGGGGGGGCGGRGSNSTTSSAGIRTRRAGNGGDAVSTEMSTVSFLYYQQPRQQPQSTATDFQQQQQQLLATKATIQEQLPSTTYHRHHVQLPPQYQTAVVENEKKRTRYQPIHYQLEYEKQQIQHQNSQSTRSGDANNNNTTRRSISRDEVAVSLVSQSGSTSTGTATTTGPAAFVAPSSSAVSSLCQVVQHHQPAMHEVSIRSGTPSVIERGRCSDPVGEEALSEETALGDETTGEMVNAKGGEKRSRSKHRPLFRRLFHYVRNTLTGQAKKGDQDECEVYELPPRYRPESVSSLCRVTRFSEEEVKRLYRGFKAECPSGVVREDTFKIIYSQFFSARANTGNYAHFVFNTLDHDNSGIVSFEDFLQTLSILSRGTMEEKLTWTFALYDINGDGCVTREEMTNIVTAIYDMVDRPSMSAAIAAAAAENESVPGGTVAAPLMPMRMDGERIKQKVDQLFQKMDMNQDGVVTLDEFISCCQNDEVITNSMTIFDNILL